MRSDDVVPLRVKLAAVDVHGFELGVCDVDLVGVGALVEAGVDLESAAVRGAGDEVDDGLQRDQRLAAPVHRDEREQAMLDFVPLRGARREVADLDLELGLVGELLQLDLPQPRTVTVRATAVGGDRQPRRDRVALRAEVLPPAADRVDCELGGVVIDPDIDIALVELEVIDPVRDRLAPAPCP